MGVLVVLALAGCGISDPQHPGVSSVLAGSSPYQSANADERSDLGSLTYRAVDLMLAGAPDVRSNTPLIVASIADTQNMETSSALGNIVADMIRTRITQDGYSASEIRLRNEISFSKGEGEFLLSRNRRALMAAPNAAAIVTGTYAADYEKVYVSIKLVSATDAHIIAGADFVVPLKDVSGLMRHGAT
jgi:TolB-like protein